MRFDSIPTIPAKIKVGDIVVSRYKNAKRPDSWDQRKAGEDIIRSEEGQTIKLRSDGGQSTPQKGWIVMLTDGDATSGYRWTLYGMP